MQATSVPTLAGTAPTYATPTTSDTAPVGTVLIVKNGSGSPITVTLASPKTLETGDAYPSKVITVAAGGEAWIPVLKVYAAVSTQLATITYSSVTTVTAAVIMYTPV
ncbi:hypothetical protein AB4Z38_07105 [Arthrobacter sp. 2RAF6]|uniref:hypothetical protein n=1 Tax=Arthrobacter sp. 2RAF6 TaxID=3233002 RepID=UPI003F8FB70E